MVLPTVSLQNMRVIRRVTRMLDAQSTHIIHGVEHVLIPILCRTPMFLLKKTKETAPPQEDKEDAMDEDGESVEEDSSSDSEDDEGDIPAFGSRRRGESVEEYDEEGPPTQGLGAFRQCVGMGGTNEVPADTPENETEPPRVAGISFKRGTGLPSTALSEESATTPTDHMGIGAHPPLRHATDSSTMSTDSLPTSFGVSRMQQSFVRAAPTQAISIPKAGLSTEERTQFHEDLRFAWCRSDSEDGMVGCKAFPSVGFHIDDPFRAPG